MRAHCPDRSWRAAAVSIGIAVALSPGCLHTRHVGDEPGGAEERQADKREEGASQRVTNKRIPPRDGRPAVAASPEQLMNPGSARKIQEALKSRGYLDEVSGDLDPATSAALRRFQHDRGLAATGAPDRETLRDLGVDPQDVYQTGSAKTDR